MKIIKEIGHNAHIDWIIILFLSTATALALAIGGLYLYNAVMKGNIQGSEATPSISLEKFNEKAISSVIQNFDRREEASRKALAGYGGFEDPSI